MGKNLIQQARGKGGPTYRAPSFRYKGEAKFPTSNMTAEIIDIVSCQGHSAPLFEVKYDNNSTGYLIAGENKRVGDKITFGGEDSQVTELKHIPEGSFIYNIEGRPLDGGKFVRSGGTFAKLLSHSNDTITVQLPSKKQKEFHPNCRATIGVVAAGGRTEKPFLKAGSKFYAMKAKNKLWPIVSGGSMNAVDHPFGNKRSARKSNAKPAPNNAPPGRKVGMIRPRRTGQKK
jgi:large subunit ribosomal protein L2